MLDGSSKNNKVQKGHSTPVFVWTTKRQAKKQLLVFNSNIININNFPCKTSFCWFCYHSDICDIWEKKNALNTKKSVTSGVWAVAIRNNADWARKKTRCIRSRPQQQKTEVETADSTKILFPPILCTIRICSCVNSGDLFTLLAFSLRRDFLVCCRILTSPKAEMGKKEI